MYKIKQFFRMFFGRYWFMALIFLFGLIFMCVVKGDKQLDVYQNGNDSVYTKLENDQNTNETEAPTKEYQNGTVAFGMMVPEDWNYVLKDGCDTFIHTPSATSIQINVLDYYPQINNVNDIDTPRAYEGLGFTVYSFETLTNNSYMVYYQDADADPVVDYIDLVIWDRAHVVKLTGTIYDEYYDQMESVITGSFDTLTWEYENPVPEDLRLYYILQGDVEVALPMAWQAGESDGAIYAYDETTDGMMTVNILEDTTTIDGTSQVDYAAFLGEGKSEFALTVYEQSDNQIYAEALYTDTTSGIPVYLMQYYLANGVYHYIVTYEFPYEDETGLALMAKDALMLTRVFYVPEDIPETEKESEEQMPNYFERDEDFGVAEEQTEAEQEFAATFSDALCAVAGISSEAASQIDEIWNAVQAGTPTDVKAYKKSDIDLIVQVQTSSGDIAYLYIENETGSLEKIVLNSETGPSLYER